MRAPAGNARANKYRCVELSRNAHQEIGDRRIEIEIGIETFFLLHDAIDDGRDFVPTVVAADLAQRFGLLLNDGRASVTFLEHTMTEAHDPAFVCQPLLHPSLRPLAALDFEKH